MGALCLLGHCLDFCLLCRLEGFAQLWQGKYFQFQIILKKIYTHLHKLLRLQLLQMFAFQCPSSMTERWSLVSLQLSIILWHWCVFEREIFSTRTFFSTPSLIYASALKASLETGWPCYIWWVKWVDVFSRSDHSILRSLWESQYQIWKEPTYIHSIVSRLSISTLILSNSRLVYNFNLFHLRNVRE